MTLVDEWRGLLQHPGWLRLTAWARQEWVDQIDQHLATAVNDTNDLLALQKMRQVIAAKRAVENVLAYPQEQLRQAEHAREVTATPMPRSRV